MPELKKGYAGPLYNPWYDWAKRKYSKIEFLLGARDGYFGSDEERFVRQLQSNLGIVIDGRFGDRTASAAGYTWPGTAGPPAVLKRRKIWIYSAPGSGGNWDQGPSFDLGNRCKDVLNINHQPIGFQMGGYLGFMGGDPSFSYNDVTYDQYKSLEYLLDHNPDINDPDVELWFSGYSQSADGMEDALEILFGDGGFVVPKTGEVVGPGKFRHLRDRINGVVQFGNPSTKGTGIARKVRPEWLDRLVRNINYVNDFYAVAPDAIRPAMYAIIIEANMALPFFVHVLRLAARIVPEWLTLGAGALGGGGLLGGILGGSSTGGAFGNLSQLIVGNMAGVGGNPLFGQLFGMAGSKDDTKVDDDLYRLLTPTGVLSNIPAVIGLIAALPGLQAHGGYPFDPAMMDRAYNVVAGFRR